MMKLFGKKKGKKGQSTLGVLENVVISLVVVGFLLIIGLSLMGRARDTTTSGTAEYNASTSVITAISSIPGWLTVIVLAFIAVVVLGAVYMLKGKQE